MSSVRRCMQPSCSLINVTNKRGVQKSRRRLTVVNLARPGFSTLYMVRGQESNPDVVTQSPDTVYKVI